MSESTSLSPVPESGAGAMTAAGTGQIVNPMTVAEIVGHVRMVQEVREKLLKPDIHFGIIPGTKKQALYQPGAQILAMAFRLRAEWENRQSRDGNHLTVESRCRIYHQTTGLLVAEGLGLCSTRETKYAWRNGERKCPSCGAAAIIKGKAEYGGGFVCFAKKGGCGAKYEEGDEAIVGQTVGRVENPELADTENTVMRMAAKRAYVHGMINATCATDIFTPPATDDGAPPPYDDEPEAAPPPRPRQPTPPADPAATALVRARARFKAAMKKPDGKEIAAEHGLVNAATMAAADADKLDAVSAAIEAAAADPEAAKLRREIAALRAKHGDAYNAKLAEVRAFSPEFDPKSASKEDLLSFAADLRVAVEGGGK